MMLGPSGSMVVPDLEGLSSVVVILVEVCIFAALLVVVATGLVLMLLLDDGSCILLWKLAVALIVRMVVDVAILNQDFVEVLVDRVDVEIGFATWLGGELLLLLCW